MITTKKGDAGQSHFLGKVVDKDSPLLEAVGSVDELQAILELIGEEEITDDLSKIMGELACDVKFKELESKIKKIEEKMEEEKIDLKNFLKFKSKKAGELNWARTVCRRAERRIVTLDKNQKIDKNMMVYFNRLSDYLFLKAVKANKK